MNRQPYILKGEEISLLLSKLNHDGEKELYNSMKQKADFMTKSVNDLDEIFLDMSNTFVSMARDIETDSEELNEIRQLYLSLSRLLRKVGHETYRSYIKCEKTDRNHERFLHIVS
jgi:hypothetical protein